MKIREMNGSLTDQPSGKWQRFKTKLHGFEIYQIFVVRAWQRQTSRGWYALMFISGCFVYCCLCIWIQTAVSLEEMRKAEGVVESFVGHDCKAVLMLRTDDGELQHYSTCEPGKGFAQRAIGKRAVVWSESQVIPPFVWRMALRQLQVGTTLEQKFSSQNAEKLRRITEKIIKFFLPFALVALFRIWWVNRKAESRQ